MEGAYEIFARVSKLKKKNEKIAELRKVYNQVGPLVDLCYNPKYVWLLPEGAPPYKPQHKDADVQGVLMQSIKKFGVFLQNNGYDGLKAHKREQIFIEYLEAMDPKDAELVISIKDRKLPFKSLTKELFEDAFPNLKTAWEATK